MTAACAVDSGYGHDAEISVLGGGKADGDVPKKKWTFLLYGAADNNLADSILADVNELESVGSTDQVNLLAFLDTPQGASVNYLLADSDTALLHSPTASWGARDSGEVQTLIDVAEWAIASYPADRYALIVSGHGGGSPRVIAPDDSTGHAIPAAELPRAVEVINRDRHYPMQLFGADACLMQTIEVAYELRGRAGTVVASENTEPGTGWNYSFIGKRLTAEPDQWGRSVAELMVGSYQQDYLGAGVGATLSALDSDEFLRPPSDGTYNIANQLQRLVTLLVAHAGTTQGRSELRDFASRVYRVYGAGDDYADLDDLLRLLASSSAASIRSQVALAQVALQQLVFSAWSDPSLQRRPGGVSIYFPAYFPAQANAADLADYSTHYAFAHDIGWDTAVRAIHGL